MTQAADMIILGPGICNWHWVSNAEVEKLRDGEHNNASAWKQHSEEEIIKPVEDIDKEESHREDSTSMTINVVWVFYCKN